MENIPANSGQNIENLNSKEQVTGVEGGVSTSEQLLLALEVIAANNGEAAMPQIYAALEKTLDGPDLSDQGKATLRRIVNSDAVKKGFVYQHDPNSTGWRITAAGKDFLANTAAQKALLTDQTFNKEIDEHNQPEISDGFGEDAVSIAQFQKSIQTNLPIIKKALTEYPGWLLTNFPGKVQLLTVGSRLDVYVYRVWLHSGWFNKTRGFFVHFRDQGLNTYNRLESTLHPNSELGKGNYNNEPTIRFFVKVDKDYARLKELTTEAIKKYETDLTLLAPARSEAADEPINNQYKAMFLSGWWRRLNEITENSSSSPGILAKETFSKAGYQAAQDYFVKYKARIEESSAKLVYYQAYLDSRKAGNTGDWLNMVDLTSPIALFKPEAIESLIFAFKEKFKDFSSAKYMAEERNPKLKEIDKAKKLLNREQLADLLAAESYDVIKTKIKQLCQNPFLKHWDYLTILNADPEPLAKNFWDFLYSDKPINDRFENWVLFLEPTKPRSWPVTSYFLLLFYSETSLFVKPMPFREFLEAVDSSIEWETRPTYIFYTRLLELAQQLLEILRPLGARDFIDVQSFIWIAKDIEVMPDVTPKDEKGTGELKPAPPVVVEPPVKNYTEPGLAEISQAIGAQGIILPDGVLRRYHLSLKTRGFVILSGLSGSGKTWLAEAYANAVDGQFCLVAVAPNWTTNEDLLGYFSPMTGKYHDTSVSRFIKAAEQAYLAATKAGVTPPPYFLVLDEMNLARVEYYFARFLSAMEIRARGEQAVIELSPEDRVILPPNFYFTGTVNVDETTHGFADKVYDRAQLIEMSVNFADLKNFLGAAAFSDQVLDIWKIVYPIAPFAFRVLNEIKVYIGEAEKIGLSWQSALDEQILQKVLPKLKGTDPRLGPALGELEKYSKDKLPLTYIKASRMAWDFRTHGFTSYF